MTLLIEARHDRPVAQRRMELVERKGLGHPDTMCDALAEAISRALSRLYQEETGRILHYNIDKALLVAGQCVKGFGHGRLLRPMELIIGDRATLAIDGRSLPVEAVAREAVNSWVAGHMPHLRPDTDLQTRIVLAPGSAELRGVLDQAEIASNDTCGASGYAPLTSTETLVLEAEQYLNGREFKGAFPDTGQDVKVFAIRQEGVVDVTVAMPLRCIDIASEAAYFERKAEILAALATRFGRAPLEVRWSLDALDRPGLGPDGVYLTLTGTSAEDADSGQVGRGNRANGLIAFARATGGEAAAGKNPLAHAGKVYSVLSHRLARLIHARCPEITEVSVHLASRIGDPVDRPWTAVELILPSGLELADVEGAVREVVESEIQRLPVFRAELVRGEYPVC